MTRRQLIGGAAAGVVAMAAKSDAQAGEKPPAISAELVKAFVIAGHGDLKKVEQMLEKEPGLLNATWDWGGGDFESALEGAGHMGNREIALYLISKGARPSIFQAAMLGDLELVKAFLAAHPSLKAAKGPHGIPLMAHAERGGPRAEPVLAFLRTLG